MKFFAYRAADYSGNIIKGSIASETTEAATRDLGTRGLYIISIRESASHLDLFRRMLLSIQIKRSDILEFTGSFSVMLKSGTPIIACLDDIIMVTPNPSFRMILWDIKRRLESGASVTNALESQGKIFPDIIKTLVSVGEETGHLDESLREATEHLQRMQNLSGAIKKALMYPAIALIATLGALMFWMLFVIPSLSQTLKALGVTLPLLTVLLIKSSGFFQAHWQLVPVTAIFMPVAIFLLRKLPAFKYQLDRALIRIPVLDVIIFNKLLAIFTEQFRLLMAAGIPMIRLFDLLVPSVGNEYFGVNLLIAKKSILSGKPISESLDQQKILPPLVISKIRIGEASGNLDKQLDILSKYYTKKLDDATETFGKVIEPLVMVVIGGLFAIIIMGLLLPVYDLVSKMGKL